MIARLRTVDANTVATHGGNRRPSKADRTPVDVEAFAEFNRGTARAVAANRDRRVRERFLDSMWIYHEAPR